MAKVVNKCLNINAANTFYIMVQYSIYLYIYKIEMFVCLFMVNAKTTAWIGAKHSVITKNDPESVLCGLKSPILCSQGDIVSFPVFSSRLTAILTYLPLPALA